MSEPPDFRLEQSELRGEDEYTEFGPEDLEYYVDVPGTFDKLPLFSSDILERNAEYYLRIRAHTMPRNASFVWPWERGIAGLAKFTFLQ